MSNIKQPSDNHQIKMMLRALLSAQTQKMIVWVASYVGGASSEGSPYIILYPQRESWPKAARKVYKSHWGRLPQFVIDGWQEDVVSETPTKNVADKRGIRKQCQPFEIVMELGEWTDDTKSKRKKDLLGVLRYGRPLNNAPQPTPQPPAPPAQPAATQPQTAVSPPEETALGKPFDYSKMIEKAPDLGSLSHALWLRVSKQQKETYFESAEQIKTAVKHMLGNVTMPQENNLIAGTVAKFDTTYIDSLAENGRTDGSKIDAKAKALVAAIAHGKAMREEMLESVPY